MVIVGLIAVLGFQFIEIDIFTNSFFATLERVDAFLHNLIVQQKSGGAPRKEFTLLKRV